MSSSLIYFKNWPYKKKKKKDCPIAYWFDKIYAVERRFEKFFSFYWDIRLLLLLLLFHLDLFVGVSFQYLPMG